MIPNNNLTVFPWYIDIERQNARKWWVYGRIYPLYTPAMYMLPFQILRTHRDATALQYFLLYTKDGTVIGDYTEDMAPYITVKQFPSRGYDVIVFLGNLPVFPALNNGQYYAMLQIAGVRYFSEVFTVVNDIEPYLKLQWYDLDDFHLDSGVIVYKEPNFKNILYLNTSIAKPQYSFEEEGEIRDGYFFPTKLISEKKYRFNFLSSEYLLDVLRFVRMADFASIEFRGQTYELDTFLITPTWTDEGDVAVVEAEFETATVAKKIGTGYIKAQRGDYNDDFNNDFYNQ